MILNDRQIRQFILNGGMENAVLGQLNHSSQIGELDRTFRMLSSGVSSAGYDFRMQGEYYIPRKRDIIYDVKNNESRAFWNQTQARHDANGDFVVVPPHCTLLARTMEIVHLPKDILILMIGKSTYARAGINVLFTPIEPGFEGSITLEITNTQPYPVRVYEHEGIAQGIFMQLEECEQGYGDRIGGAGKYQNQLQTTFGKV